MGENKGQALINLVEGYIRKYVTFPDASKGQSLVMALWCVHTWLYERFSTTPYLVITASTKQAGKTLCMEVLSLICRGSQMMATLRPLALVRVMEAYEGRVTLFCDEAEKLSSGAVGDLRSIFTSGYRVGGMHLVSAGTGFKRFRTFAPKCFALIGDVMDVVRDRSIVVTLQRAKPVADFHASHATAEQEAIAIQAGILAYFDVVPELVQPEFLSGREREIWAVLFSVAKALKLDAATMHTLEATCADLVGAKSAEARAYNATKESEAQAGDVTASEAALRDLASVLKAGEKGIFSKTAIERMKAIPTSPWRTFKGEGLTQHGLAALISRFGIVNKSVRMPGVVGTASGYGRAQIEAAAHEWMSGQKGGL